MSSKAYLVGIFTIMVATSMGFLSTRSWADDKQEGAYPDTPEAVVKAMVTAAIAHDMEETQKYMSEDFISQCNAFFKKTGGVEGYWKQLTKDFSVESWTQDKTEPGQSDSVKIRIHLKFKGGNTFSTRFPLNKKDGRWIADMP